MNWKSSLIVMLGSSTPGNQKTFQFYKTLTSSLLPCAGTMLEIGGCLSMMDKIWSSLSSVISHYHSFCHVVFVCPEDAQASRPDIHISLLLSKTHILALIGFPVLLPLVAPAQHFSVLTCSMMMGNIVGIQRIPLQSHFNEDR